MQTLADKFSTFYNESNHNKNLTFLNQYGSCEIKALFNDQGLVITTTPTQACLLSKFNIKDEWTFAELSKELGVSIEVWKENIRPLVFGKGAIIRKKRPNLNWDLNEETLTLNLKYTSASKKVRLIPKEKNVS